MRNNVDVFEWSDATQKIVEKAVRERDLGNAAENMKNQAESSLNQNFNQFDFENVLSERDTVVKSIQQNLSPKLDAFEKREELLDERIEDNDFQRNLEDNAVDRSDWNDLMESYNLLKEIHSLTTIWAFVAHANSQDVAKAVNIQQMQADQNEAMKLVNENYDKFISAADKIGRQVKQGQKEALKEVLDERDDKIESLESEKKELERELEELQDKGVDLDDPKPLAEREAELADLVQDNPDEGVEFFMDEMDLPKKTVRKLESQIQNKGYKFSID